MTSGNLLTIGSIFYSLMLMIIFFGRKKIKTLENKIYSYLIITNFFGLLIAVACYYTVLNNDIIPYINYFVSRLYLIYLLAYILLFFYYLIVSLYTKNNEENKLSNTFKNILIAVFILLTVVIYVLPLNYHNTDAVYSYGPAANVVYIFATLCMSIWTILLVINRKKLRDKKMLPIIVFIILSATVTVIQKINPSLLLMTSMETFVVVIMYFTIENPDLNMLRELEYQKEQVETSKNISSRVINTISDSLSTSVNKINSFGHKKINYDNADELKKSVAEVQKFALEFVNDISSLIELSKTQSEGFEVVNTNYEPLQMLNEIEDSLNAKDKRISVSISKNSTVPAVLYGDPTKIKQCLLHLYNGILNISKVKNIDFKVTYLVVGSLCRFKVNAEVSSKDLLEEYTKDLKDKIIDFEIIDRIAKLLEGKFTIAEDDNNQIKFELTADEKYLEGYYVKEETKSQINKKIDYIDLSSKKVLIIDDDKERQSHLMNLLSPYKIETLVSSDYNSTKKECIENKFDLVIIDDIIPELDRIKNYLLIDDSNGLLKVMDHIEYDVPRVIMVTPNTKNYEAKYIEEGFDEVITKPVDKYKIDEIIKSIVKDKEQDM